MSHLLAKIKHELINAIPAVIYFALAFNLIHFNSNNVRQPGDFKYFTYLGVNILALFIGKVIVIVNCFSFINAYPTKPMIYNIIWKLFIYNSAIFIL